MHDSLEYYKLTISIAAIITALFVLFFRTWWDDNEKKNQALEEDIIRLKYLSEQVKGSIHFVEKTIESYQSIAEAIKLKNYEVPERNVIFQIVLENISNIKDVEHHSYVFSKYYQKYYSNRYEDVLFTKVTTSYKFMLLFEQDLTRRFEVSRQKQTALKERFIKCFYEVKALVNTMIKNPKNAIIASDLHEILMSQTKVDFNNYDVLYIYNNYILKVMEISVGRQENNGFIPEGYEQVFSCYENAIHIINLLKENITNSFSEFEFYLNSFENNLLNIKELSTNLEDILKKMDKPVKGDFFIKLQHYMSRLG